MNKEISMKTLPSGDYELMNLIAFYEDSDDEETTFVKDTFGRRP